MITSVKKRLALALFCITHRRSLSAIQRWQNKWLKRLLMHAYRHVPLWQEIFLHAHIDVEHCGGLEKLQEISLTSKDTYTGRMIEEYIDGSSRFVQEWGATSGSSGTPFKFLLASQYIGNSFFGGFSFFRFLLWNGKRLEDIAKTRIALIKREVYSSLFRLGLNYADFRDDQTAEYLKLAEFKPEVLSGYPSVLLDIAQMVDTDKTLPPLRPRYIVSSGEMLTPSIRSFVSEQLGAEIYNRYGLEEIGAVGTECSRHDGFHINSESIIVEITDESGKPLAENKVGKVIVTDLFNYNMPFIRYDTGDRGSLSSEPCACGLYTTRLWLEGRSTTYLTFGERHVYRYEFVALDKLMNEVLQYQVLKRGEQDILLRVIPGPSWGETTMEKVEEGARKFLGNDIRISVKLVSHISKAPSGKSNLIVDETVSVSP